jgi:hypothetical protein
MVQNDRGLEVACQAPHLGTALSPGALLSLVCPRPRAKHVEIVAAKNKHTLAGQTQDVRVQIGYLNEVALLAACWIRLAGPKYSPRLQVVHGDQFRVLGTVISNEIDSNRDDVNLPAGRLHDTTSYGSLQGILRMGLEHFKISSSGTPTDAS